MKRWQSILRSRRVRVWKARLRRFHDGIKYALGLGPIWVCTICPTCEQEITVEAD